MAHRSPIVIAEIGCNHKGDFEIAKEMVRIAKVFCNADAVKFQKRNTRELLTAEEYNAPHPNPVHSYGETYGKHREFLEFDLAKHQELKQFADELGIDYSCSVWDLTSAREIVSLHPKYLKIPSACNLNFELLGYLCENFPGEIHISLGMTSRAEEERIVAFLESKNRNRDTVLYSCVSGYPVPHENVSLLDIRRLKSVFGSRAKSIGFSGPATSRDTLRWIGLGREPTTRPPWSRTIYGGWSGTSAISLLQFTKRNRRFCPSSRSNGKNSNAYDAPR